MKIRSTLFNFENILLIFWVGFLLSINSKKYLIDNLERYHLIISMIGALLIIHVTEYFKFKNLILKILYCSILFITIISLYFTFFIVLELINDERVFYLYFNHTLLTEGKHLLQVYPRITGISRMLGLVLLFIFSLFICRKRNISIYNFFLHQLFLY